MQPAHPQPQPSLDRGQLAKLFQLTGVWLLVFLALFFLSTALLYFLRVTIGPASFLPALLLSMPAGWLLARRSRLERRAVIAAAVGLGLFALAAVLVSGAVFDISWDGMDYHQRSIYRLAEGFNPVYEIAGPIDEYYNVWFNHYVKGPWYFGAALYRLTGSIESGKAINWLMLAAAACLSLAFFLRQPWLGGWQAALIGLMLAANPVALSQIFSYYIDGLVASALLITVLALALYRESEPLSGALGLSAAMVIGLNIKFTASAYMAVFVGLGWLYLLWRARSRAFALRLTAVLAAGGLLGLLLAGYSSYVTNTLRHGNPLYPLLGGEEYNQAYIIQQQAPPDFLNRGQAEKLALSLFARAGNGVIPGSLQLKAPFAVQRDDLIAFFAVDVRYSGFGPWFSGALLLAGLVLIAGAGEDRRRAALALGCMALAAGSTFINSENWWARYAPQIWWVPVIALALGLSLKARPVRLLAALLAAALALNLGMVAGPITYYNLRSTREIAAHLETLADSPEPVLFSAGPFAGWVYRLERYGVPYQLVTEAELPCPQHLPLAAYSPAQCP